MGYYIQTGNATGKAKVLIEKHNAEVLTKPPIWQELPANKALICIVHNRFFDAAGLCFSKAEFNEFNLPHDARPKTWLYIDKELAFELAQYP